MATRREFLQGLAGAGAGIVFVGCGLVDAARAAMQVDGKRKRREVVVGGRRVKTVDVHCHCLIPEVWDLIKDYEFGQFFREQLDGSTGKQLNFSSVQERLRVMDDWGIEVQAVSINPFWYSAERDLARQIVKLQNEKLAELCAAHPDRFVGMATTALQYPYLAAEQLEEAVKKLGMRAAAIGGSVNGEDLSAPKFRPFWAKAEELGILLFMHPQPQGVASQIRQRLQGNGLLNNVIGNPLETTIALSHLIFEGTLDRFPGLKICAAHGGGFLPSYMGRSDACLVQSPASCKPVKKRPSEYLKQLYFDSLVFTSEGLRHLAAEAGASQIVLGTDFPFGWPTNGVDHILDTPGLSDADRRAMLGETAVKLLRIAS